MTFCNLAEVADKQGKLGESRTFLQRAVDLAEELTASELGASSICLLAESRDRLAQVLADQGDQEAARSLIAANRRMLADVTVDTGDPAIIAWRVFTQFVDMEWASPRSPVAAPAGDSAVAAPEVGSSRSLVFDVHDHGQLPADRWAELAGSVLDSATAANASPARRAEAGFWFVDRLVAVAAKQRRSEQLDLARRTAERIRAFAGRLVARYPGEPFAHLAVGDAFVQLHKNAWRIGDRPTIERTLKLALDAAPSGPRS